MAELFLLGFCIILCFGFVLLFGAPYLPTHKKQAHIALDLLDLKPGQTLYELGCGDGKLLILAASRGYNAVGYEMNPIIFLICWLRTWRYRKSVKVYCRNFWLADLSKADGVYVFLLDRFMSRLDRKLSSELNPGVRLASYTFKIPGKKLFKSSQAVYIYEY